MAGFYVPLRMGQLTINPSGVSAANLETNLRAPSWLIEDMSPLWGLPDHYGSNLRVPGADGMLALERFVDQTVYQVPFIITGEAAYDGTPYTNPLYGLRQNRDRLLANVHGEIPGQATRVAKLTLPYESPPAQTLLADVQCTIALGSMVGPNLRAVLEIKIPAGGFA